MNTLHYDIEVGEHYKDPNGDIIAVTEVDTIRVFGVLDLLVTGRRYRQNQANEYVFQTEMTCYGIKLLSYTFVGKLKNLDDLKKDTFTFRNPI